MDKKRDPAPLDNPTRELASRGLRDPNTLAPADVQHLCRYVLQHSERRRGAWESIVGPLSR